MPQISKQTLSQFLKTECYRQLKFILSPHDNKKYAQERLDYNIPPRQEPRPGMALVTRAGVEWEKEKYAEVQEFFNDFTIIGNADENGGFKTIQLLDTIAAIEKESFIMQPEYKIEESSIFENLYGIKDLRKLVSNNTLELSKLRPDIIQVLPPKTYDHYVAPNGKYVLIDGESKLIQLKIIDIKHTSEPSISHFSELAYYMITLSCWIKDHHLDDKLQVVSGAVWPGSHDASTIRKKVAEYRKQGCDITNNDLVSWLNDDLIEIPFEVFISKIIKFFKKDLVYVLQNNWEQMDYHVNSSCKHCDYLGYPWKNGKGEFTYHENHCMQLALQEDHLSRIADMSKAAKLSLINQHIVSGANLSILNEDNKVFENHQTLKSKRILYPQRALSLIGNKAIVPENVGTSSVMPKWSDLSIFITVDFDITSAITACIGVKAVWVNTKDKKELVFWPPKDQKTMVYMVDSKDIDVEKRVLIKFLEFLQKIIDDVKKLDADSTYQIYIWDSIQYEHIKRVISRNLEAIIQHSKIRDLVWLFPSEETMGNPDIQRQSPITVVKDCIGSLTALPIPHYYSLLETARTYGNPQFRNMFNVHPLFEDALSDQIPSERIHEIWSKINEPYLNWTTQLGILTETVGKRVNALHSVTQTLQKDIRPMLIEIAPKISKSLLPTKQGKMCYPSELLFMFSKLDAKLDELDILAKRSLPIYEREAKFDSAILTERIEEKDDILKQYKIRNDEYTYMYKLSRNSTDVRIKEGDFSVALSPNCDATFLNRKICTVLFNVNDKIKFLTLQYILKVTVLKIDRENKIIVIRTNSFRDADNNNCDPIKALENAGISFKSNISLDPVSSDYFTKKLKEALQDIGNPQITDTSVDEVTQIKQTGLTNLRPRKTPITPASKILWDMDSYKKIPNVLMKNMDDSQINNLLVQANADLEKENLSLNPSQEQAWRQALTKSISIIWGPPGTGKSKTLVSLIQSAITISKIKREPLRILITSFTYNAIDNVLFDVADKVNLDTVLTVRLCSESKVNPSCPKAITQICTSSKAEVEALKKSLSENTGITIVGAPAQQIHKLLTDNSVYGHKEYFDLIIIDEASQMNVANAILAFCALAMEGSLVLAGDGLQLPPIHKAEIPLGCENKVGSIYDYYEKNHGIVATMLEVNYRSNQEIVNFIKEAGYKTNLISYSTDLEIRVSNEKIDDLELPKELYKCDAWNELIDPRKKICCFTYPDGMSSQWNEFEVDSVATICAYLKGSLYSQLNYEKDATGNNKSLNDKLYDDLEFWTKGIGIVTPHRAQQSKIASKLDSLFAGGDPVLQESIRNCVDTVERFQGQQRDIIIVSFALGDVDMIGNEEEFIMNLNRFNVMISRARAKVIVLLSEELSYYLASDIDVLNESKLLSKFANTYCDNLMNLSLGYISDGELKEINGTLKYM